MCKCMSPCVLGLKESAHGIVMCSMVPKKGTSYKGVVNKIIDWLDDLGYPEIILKCDQEPSIEQI